MGDRHQICKYHWLRGICRHWHNLIEEKHDSKDFGADGDPAPSAAVETSGCSGHHRANATTAVRLIIIAHNKPYSIVGLLSFVKRLFRISASYWHNETLLVSGLIIGSLCWRR